MTIRYSDFVWDREVPPDTERKVIRYKMGADTGTIIASSNLPHNNGLLMIASKPIAAGTVNAPIGYCGFLHIYENFIQLGSAFYSDSGHACEALEENGVEKSNFFDDGPLYSALYCSTDSASPLYMGSYVFPAQPMGSPRTECESARTEREGEHTLVEVSWDDHIFAIEDRVETVLLSQSIGTFIEESDIEKKKDVKFIFTTPSGSRTECMVRAEHDASLEDFMMALAQKNSLLEWSRRMIEEGITPFANIERAEGGSYIHVKMGGLSGNEDRCVTAYLVRVPEIDAYEVSFSYHRRGTYNRKLGNDIARLRHSLGRYVIIINAGSRYETIERHLKAVYLGEFDYVIEKGPGKEVNHPKWLKAPPRNIPKDIQALLVRIKDAGVLEGDLLLQVNHILSGVTPKGEAEDPDFSAIRHDGDEDEQP